MDDLPEGYYWATHPIDKDEPALVELGKVYFLGDDWSYSFNDIEHMGIKLYPMPPRVQELP